MKITIDHIMNLLGLFEKGLINGAGQTVNHFCVQQAVHRVLDDDLENPTKNDHPPTWCVNDEIIAFGINMNDQQGWHSNKLRAKGLQRFAIAELGSSKINHVQFYERLAKKLASVMSKNWEEFYLGNEIIDQFMLHKIGGMDKNDRLTWLANAAADVLMELGTEGSQFLYLIDEPDRKLREEKARALGHKIYAAQMADGTAACNWGIPRGKHDWLKTSH
jgi:hypothetical protein